MKRALLIAVPLAVLAGAIGLVVVRGPSRASADSTGAATPIQHLVVIYDENVSFDHYFGTYPDAANPVGEPRFVAKPGTPSVDGLTPALLQHNPNSANPFRLDRADFQTCDQLHEYPLEQRAADGGRMDKFVEFTGTPDPHCTKSQVMGYYDGNTVTALWNYAQRFSMSDAFYGSTYGPSSPGALNLVAGTTAGASPRDIPEEVSNGTVIGDPDPAGDVCSTGNAVSMSGSNIGDLLNEKSLTWGWFEGGFRDCHARHANLSGTWETDYEPHHEPFQYFASTRNPTHAPPSSTAAIGTTDVANHQYDLSDFWAAADAGHLPAVSFLKAANYQDGHASSSNPLDEQTFLVQTINRIQQLPQWSDTAIVIAYDDSDGWYDHAFVRPSESSNDPVYDGLDGQGLCGTPPPAHGALDRCGPGPRLPLLVLSPYAKRNAVSHVPLEQASIIRFIEDNWSLGRLPAGSFDARAASLTDLFDFSSPDASPLILDAATGNPPTTDPPLPPTPVEAPPVTTAASAPPVTTTGSGASPAANGARPPAPTTPSATGSVLGSAATVHHFVRGAGRIRAGAFRVDLTRGVRGKVVFRDYHSVASVSVSYGKHSATLTGMGVGSTRFSVTVTDGRRDTFAIRYGNRRYSGVVVHGNIVVR